MKKRIDFFIHFESENFADQAEVYHGTIKEAKRSAKALYRTELKKEKGGRVIIKIGEENDKDYGKVVSSYSEEEGWVDFIADIVNK